MEHRIAYDRKHNTYYYNGVSWTKKYKNAKVFYNLTEPLLIMSKFKKQNKKICESIHILFK